MDERRLTEKMAEAVRETYPRMGVRVDLFVRDASPALLPYARALVDAESAIGALDDWTRNGSPLTLLARLDPIVDRLRETLASIRALAGDTPGTR